MTDDQHCYPEPDPEEGFLFVREWEDNRLREEYLYLARLFYAVASEAAFRADHPEYRDGTGGITAADSKAYEAADGVAEVLAGLDYTHPDADRE